MPTKKAKLPKIKVNKRKAWNGRRCYATTRKDNKSGVVTDEYRKGYDQIDWGKR